MPSFRILVTPSRRASARHVQRVRRALQKAYAEEKGKNGLTYSEIARRIGVHRSVINREMRGQKDMTIGRVGELAWAMGRAITFLLPEMILPNGSNLPPPTMNVRIETSSTASTFTPTPPKGGSKATGDVLELT